MKRLFPLILVPALAFGWSGDGLSLTTNQSLTQAAPTAATAGFDLMNINGFRVSVCAPSGQTLSGAGSLRAYLIHQATGLVYRNPSLDLAVSVTSTSCGGSACRCQMFPDMAQDAQLGGQLYYAADSVTVSSGSTVDVRIDGWRNKR